MDTFNFSGGYVIGTKKQLIINSLVKNCKNLTQLTLSYFKFYEDEIITLKPLFSKLISLNLSRCSLECSFLDFLKEMPFLEHLYIGGNISLKGNFFKNINQDLRTLSIHHNTQIEYTLFLDYIIRKKDTIFLLNVSFCPSLDLDLLLTDLVDCQRNLVTLNIGNLKIKDLSPIHQMKKLKALIMFRLSELETFNLDIFLNKLTDSIPELLHLDISFCTITKIGQNALIKMKHLEILRMRRLITHSYEFLYRMSCKNSLKTLEITDIPDEEIDKSKLREYYSKLEVIDC